MIKLIAALALISTPVLLWCTWTREALHRVDRTGDAGSVVHGHKNVRITKGVNRPMPEPATDHCFQPLTIKKGK